MSDGPNPGGGFRAIPPWEAEGKPPPEERKPDVIRCKIGGHGRGQRFGSDRELRPASGHTVSLIGGRDEDGFSILRGPLPVCVDCWENPKFWKACRWCGKEHFAPPRSAHYGTGKPWAGFCDIVCGLQWHQQQEAIAEERRKAKRRVKHKKQRCAWCKEWFVPTRSDAKFCSPACRQAAYRASRSASV
jgi:hypothetical protein